jgi:hypothetical protein
MDTPQSFVSAVQQKYSSGITDKYADLDLSKETKFSSKVAQEVGFDKIRKQLAQLQDLKIVLVDNLRIRDATNEIESIEETCPSIIELDLSRNLLEDWRMISNICRELKNLKSLRIK